MKNFLITNITFLAVNSFLQ